MNDEIKKLGLEYHEIMSLQKFNPTELDYSVLNHYKNLLNILEEQTANIYEIFDLYKLEHICFSKSYEQILGYNFDDIVFSSNDLFSKYMNENDLIDYLKIGNHFLKFGITSDISDKMKYKLVIEFNLKNSKGEFVRLNKQFKALELDRYGNIWLSLQLISFVPYDENEHGVNSILVNTETGESTRYEITEKRITNNLLTDRENMILQMIANGKSSQDIANELFLSKHTVNTHRQHIITKLGVKNTTEAINFLK